MPLKQRGFVVQIEPHFEMTEAQLYNKLVSWLETFGHTSVGHGFDFKQVDQPVKNRRKAKDVQS